jgi:hypothetical protein
MTQNANASKKENTKSKYKDTIFLPSTSFSVKAKPQKNESIWLEYWDREKIYDTRYKLPFIANFKNSSAMVASASKAIVV